VQWVLPLDDAAADLATAGGKGAAPARMARAGLPIPGGFHITTDTYRWFVSGFRDEINPGDPEGTKAPFARHGIPGRPPW
jgi:rifampicin phosphotransferase